MLPATPPRIYCQEVKLPVVCPHSLRGLYSTLALEMGVTSSAVASALGHGSFEVTAKHYADPDRLCNARLRRVAEVLAPDEESDREPNVLLARLRALPKDRLAQLLQRLGEQTWGVSAAQPPAPGSTS